ncbi:MAG: hypothetical protein IJ349_11420 [Clostridia bacterium]|nr:hypothetical protein [Clostridia bacterium]
MSTIERIIDIVVTFGWSATYTLVLVGSRKYKFPLMSLLAQLIIASLEIAIFIGFVLNDYKFDYVYFAYFYWSLVEIIIIFTSIKQKGFTNKKKYVFFIVLTVFTIVMSFLLKINNGMLYFALLNTILGMVVWFYYILDKKYPVKPFALAIFIVKLISDVLGTVVYINSHDTLVAVFTIILPCIDFLFIILYFYRRYNKEKYDAFYDKYERYLPKITISSEEKTKKIKQKKKNKKRKYK